VQTGEDVVDVTARVGLSRFVRVVLPLSVDDVLCRKKVQLSSGDSPL
jgi:hypothetical protein